MKRITKILASLTVLLMMFSCTDPIQEQTESTKDFYQLNTPKSVKAAMFDGWAEIYWNQVPDADYYVIERKQVPAKGQKDVYGFKAIGQTPRNLGYYVHTIGFGDNGFEADTKYQYRVRAIKSNTTDNQHGERTGRFIDSNWTGAVTVDTKGVTLPAVGTKFAAPALTKTEYATTFRLTWDKNNLAAHYNISRADRRSPEFQENFLTVYNDVGDINNSNEISIILNKEVGDFDYVVTAVAGSHYFTSSDKSNAVNIVKTANLATPGYLTVSSYLSEKIEIRWPSIKGATEYVFYRKDDKLPAAGWSKITVKDQKYYANEEAFIAYDDTDLEKDVVYNYAVMARNATEISTFRYSGDARLADDVDAITIGQVTDVTATEGAFKDKIVVTFTSVKDATGYIVYKADNNPAGWSDNYKVITPVIEQSQTNKNTMIFEDTDVLAGNDTDGTKHYTYMVAAVRVEGEKTYVGQNSTAARGWVLPNTEVIVKSIAAPTGLYTKDQSATSITLVWNKVTANQFTGAVAATTYEIYRSSANTDSEFVKIATNPGTAVAGSFTELSYLDSTGLVAGGVYRYIIKAVNADEKLISTWSVSTSGSLTVMTAPTEFTAQANQDFDQVNFSWIPPADAVVENYRVYYAIVPASGTVAFADDAIALSGLLDKTTTSVAIPHGIAAGTTVRFWVAAIGKSGVSQESTGVNIAR